jgi:hypothetical protein
MNPKCNGTDYLCGKCRKLYPASAAAIDERKRQKNANRGGTMNSSNFKSKPQRNNPNVTNHYFNGPGDGKNHGHVKEHRNTDGSNSYLYARDVEGNEYKTKK